jgi:hypothetical protein
MIIVSTRGQGAARVPQMPLPDEKFLESFVALNPDVLPLQELREDLSLVVLGRQVPTLSGPIDVLAVDDQGGLYIVETKLYRNPDKRRVIAQMLDYGAAMIREIGSSFDPIGALSTKLQRDVRAIIAPDLGSADDVNDPGEQIIDGLRQCLRDGTLTFVILMDALDDRLRDLIGFVNQFSQFSVLAVEARFYRHGDTEVVVPSLFGAQRTGTRVPQRRWDEASFFAELAQRVPARQVDACRRVYDFMMGQGAEPSWGKGASGGFNPRIRGIARRSLVLVNTNARMYFNFRWMEDAPDFRERLAAELRARGFSLPDDYADRFVPLQADTWCPRVDAIIDGFRTALDAALANEPASELT